MRLSVLVLNCIHMQLMQNVEAKFRSRAIDRPQNHLSGTTPAKQTMMDILQIEHKQFSECGVPCQLEPYWITFDKVLEMSEFPAFLYSYLRPKSDGLIDVGKCIGHCSASHTPLYHHNVRLI